MRMLMQTMPKKGFLGTFVVFLVLFLICVIIGATGPAAYDSLVLSTWNCPPGYSYYDPISCSGVNLVQKGSMWSGEIRSLDRLNQELTLTFTVPNKNPSTPFVGTINVTVSIDARNSDSDPWNIIKQGDSHTRTLKCVGNTPNCNDLTVGHELFLYWSSYRYNVSVDFSSLSSTDFIGEIKFTFSYVDHNYTLFELWFRFAFLICTIVVILTYAHRLKAYNLSDWTFEQKWGAGLLFGLLAYNNPFYPLEILSDGWFPIFLNRLFYASFIVLLLFFWLILFDGIRQEQSQRTFLKFYFPKLALLGTTWISGIVIYTWAQLHENSDPVFTSASDLPGYVFFQVFMLILLIAYLFWLIFATCRTCGDLRTLPYLGVRIKFFGVYTLIIILTVVGALIFGVGTSLNNAAEFLSFLALFNLYVYVLAFVYLPSQAQPQQSSDGDAQQNTNDKIGMVNLEPDEVELTNQTVEV